MICHLHIASRTHTRIFDLVSACQHAIRSKDHLYATHHAEEKGVNPQSHTERPRRSVQASMCSIQGPDKYRLVVSQLVNGRVTPISSHDVLPHENSEPFFGHDQCNWSPYNTSISNANEMKVLTNSEYYFCLISVVRKVASTTSVNRSSTFQNLGQVTGDTFHRQQTHDGDRSPDVSDTGSHCFPGHAIISNQQVSYFVEFGEESNKGFALLQVRRRFRHGFVLSSVRGFSSFRSR